MQNLVLNIVPAIQAIFHLGYEPRQEHFHELTDEQYEQFYSENDDVSSKWYLVIPEEHEHQTGDSLVVSEREMRSLLEASKLIESYCSTSGKSFDTCADRLQFVSSMLPPVFTAGSSYEERQLKIVGSDKS